MALKEQDVVFTTKDANGNTVIQMPITRVENVEGAVKTVNGAGPNASGNVSVPNMSAATADAAGSAGLVPAPAAGSQGQYLRGDGTWQTPPDTKVTVDSVLSATSTNPVQNKAINAALDSKLDIKKPTAGELLLNYGQGGWLTLLGKDFNRADKGGFILGTTGPTLAGKPDGTLTWNGKSLLPEWMEPGIAGLDVGAVAYVCGYKGRGVSNRGDVVSGSTIRLVTFIGYQYFTSDDRVNFGMGQALSGSWRLLSGVNGEDYMRIALAVRIS